MTANSPRSHLDLGGVDGSNPLGFLAAIGALITARLAGETEVRLAWKRSATWVPRLAGVSTATPREFCGGIAEALQGTKVEADADDQRKRTQEVFDAARKVVREKETELKKRKLRGKDRKAAIDAEVRPLRLEMNGKRDTWLRALKSAVPRSELALGKHIDCTETEYCNHASAFLGEAGPANRETVDLLAAFASDACIDRGRVTKTPFCFITGSGHQYFLETVRQLLDQVTPDRVHAALFEPWAYHDEGLSMRWDPLEDRRYALLDRDPTAAGNKPRTVWMANLLAYRALVLFPTAPTNRGLATTAWGSTEGEFFTWPIWEHPADPDTVRALLQLTDLHETHPDRSVLRARGITTAFRARRIQVGNPPLHKINFSPAQGV